MSCRYEGDLVSGGDGGSCRLSRGVIYLCLAMISIKKQTPHLWLACASANHAIGRICGPCPTFGYNSRCPLILVQR